MNLHFPQPAARTRFPRDDVAGRLACFLAIAGLCEFFDGECEDVVERLFKSTAKVERGDHFLREGANCSKIFLLCSGWAARYVHLSEGRRQIVELLLPGDMFPVHAMAGGSMGEGIIALNSCVAATCSPAEMEQAIMQHANFARFVLWQTRREKGIFKAWIANLGQRDSYARFAHLICEISARLAQAGFVNDGHFEMPLTQEDLADVNGVTSVHANRTLRQLNRDGLFQFRHKRAQMLDEGGLRRAAGFDGVYLSPG